MLAQQAQSQQQEAPLQIIVADVHRVDGWLIRECPECHRTGFVSIYSNREAEAMAYITRADWTCKPCSDVRREVDRNFYARGGDAFVSGY